MTPGVEDRLLITELLSRYGLYIDSRRLDEWAGLWAQGAGFDVPGHGSLDDPAARRAMVETAPSGVHMAASPIIEAGPRADTATSQQTFMFRNHATGQVLAGWYEDVLVKEDGIWRFARRTIRYFKK